MRLRAPTLAPEPAHPSERRRAEELARTQALAERYAAQAHHPYEHRALDATLRALDLVIAGTLLAATAPLIGALMLLILVTSGRPVLYRGLRVGRAGRTFTMYKLRTLRRDAELRLGPYQATALDQRTEEELTRVGRHLRALHLDELPQLWNVVRGDMSLVGPRPIRPVVFEQLCAEIPQYWQRLVVRPGMTGFAQLRMARDMTWAEKLAHDLEWLADRSVGLYVQLIAATGLRILQRGAGDVAALRRT
ncbi:MAG TPA: sugar transferase [Solirubrobacteraceae bacterium]|nr:sugar transferase [Solirubrobacteraceae bacterium]